MVYLRSVTISHVQGSTASNAKRVTPPSLCPLPSISLTPSLRIFLLFLLCLQVTFEDGHMTLYTVFEDPNACTSYFETKIATEMGVRQVFTLFSPFLFFPFFFSIAFALLSSKFYLPLALILLSRNRPLLLSSPTTSLCLKRVLYFTFTFFKIYIHPSLLSCIFLLTFELISFV